METVAEGIEKSEELKFLRKRGCQFYQGFYFSPAVANAQFLQLMKRSQVQRAAARTPTAR